MKSELPFRITLIISGIVIIIFIAIALASFYEDVDAGVNVNVQVGLPSLVIPGPPGMAVIPNAYVYYPPEVYDNIFFYHGYWYRPHQGCWYRSPHYNGPWDYVVVNHVPRAVLAVPAGYRYGPAREHIPYGQVKKNWRKWENDHHWDKNRR